MRNVIPAILSILFLAGLAACSSATPAPGALPHAVPAASGPGRWIPTAGTTYQIQYAGKLDTSVAAAVYDLDVNDTTAATVAALHKAGAKVVCYVDVGTWEKWRPDAGKFPKSVLGKPDGGWPGERWLDVRQTKILEPLMDARMALCASKGFDGVDPDNMDGFENKTGFPLTYADSLAYDTWVARDAHEHGLTAAQKGDNDQVKDLVKVFDYAVVEQCYKQGWCKQFTLYTNQNRLVVDVEYGLPQSTFTGKTCPSDAGYNITAILKHLNLDAWRMTCR